MILEIKPTDANGEILNEGEGVYTYDLDSSKIYGTLHKNTTLIDTWIVNYEDGNECLVVDFNFIWKA